MKLHNHTILYLSVSLLAILGVWAAVFYFNMLEEVYDSLDDGLSNSKMLIIQKALQDTTILNKPDFGESNYSIQKMPDKNHLREPDKYLDTLMHVQNDSDLEPVRMLTTVFGTSDGTFYELKIITSTVEEGDLIKDLVISLSYLYIAMLVSIILVNNLILRSIWKPFYILLERLSKFRLGKDTSFSPPPTKVQEFDLLNRTLLSLLHQNIETYNSQKQFIADASHELQTPLAISINKLELLAEKNSLSENDVELVGGVIQTLERLTKLNKSLLLISKIENRQYMEEEEVDFNALSRQMVNEFTDLAEFRKVELKIKEEGKLVFNMNKHLAEILVNNLLKNAIVHNLENGNVQVVISPKMLAFENTGIASPLNETRIFERFYKASSERNSNGLGLFIAKSITDLYGLKIRYDYREKHILAIQFDS